MFELLWTQQAADMLERLIEQAGEVGIDKLVDSVARLDRRLSRDLESEGESRDGRQRFVYEEPLGVTYVVDLGLPVVWVRRVWRVRRRTS